MSRRGESMSIVMSIIWAQALSPLLVGVGTFVIESIKLLLISILHFFGFSYFIFYNDPRVNVLFATERSGGELSNIRFVLSRRCIGYTAKERDAGTNTAQFSVVRLLAPLDFEKYLLSMTRSTLVKRGRKEEIRAYLESSELHDTIIEIAESGRFREHVIRIVPSFSPTPSQMDVATDIAHRFFNSRSKTFSCYISGPPGTGKSTCARYIAAAVSGGIVRLQALPLEDKYLLTKGSFEKPSIVLLDEIDGVLNEMIEPAKPVSLSADMLPPARVPKKREWTSLLDDIDSGLYIGVIFVMTSNVPPEHFDAIDPALLRQGRVRARYVMDKEIVRPMDDAASS